jgi:hypothetical protein
MGKASLKKAVKAAKATRKPKHKRSIVSKKYTPLRSRTSSVVKTPFTKDFWKSIATLGHNPSDLSNVHRCPSDKNGWDFRHVADIASTLLSNNPDKNLYIFGGSPQSWNVDICDGIHTHIPVLGLIIIDKDHPPPLYFLR